MLKLAFILLSFYVPSVIAESVQITDSRGKLRFDKPPQRVVVINWTLTEQLLELGIKPVGVADIAGYKAKGYRPEVPAGTIDIGKRTAPDYKQIKALKPDLVLVGYSQKPLLHSLENLGTVVYFRHFSHRYDNEARSRQVFLELAKLFNKTEYAQQKLEQSDARLVALKQTLAAHYKNGLPKVTMLVPEGKSSYWLFVNNSMPFYAAKRLGLNLSAEYPPSKFGVKKLRFDKLPDELACVLVFDVSNKKSKASLERLRQKTDCLVNMPLVSPYGGAMSIHYLANTMVDALLARHN